TVKKLQQSSLVHAGTISHKKAIEKAHEEYKKYKEQTKNELSKVEKDFIKQIDSTSKKLKE
ncbi:MAG: cell filamentation protein Fic, partial [Bacteroidota bacterium]